MPNDVDSQPLVVTRSSGGELRADLKLAVQEEVRSLLSRYVKLFVVVAGVVLSAVGIGSCLDFRRTITSVVTNQVDALIQSSDSKTSVRRFLDDLVNHAIVTSSLISMKWQELAPVNRVQMPVLRKPEREVDLSVDEWTRLKKWVQDENLNDQDFADALVVLAAQEETRGRQDAKDFLAEMLNSPISSRYRWMRDQTAKRLAILQNFVRPGLEAAALEVATSDKNAAALRFAAMDYIKYVHYRQAFDGLFSLTNKPGDEELSERALLACASLEPLRSEIARAVDRTVAGPFSTLSSWRRRYGMRQASRTHRNVSKSRVSVSCSG
jgi:hypothetical protein